MDLTAKNTLSILPAETSPAVMQQRITEVLASVENADSVAIERTSFELAEKRFAQLTDARSGLNLRGRDLGNEVFAAQQQAEADLLRQFADSQSAPLDVNLLDRISRGCAESTAIAKTLKNLALRLIPDALVARLQTESRVHYVRAVEIERIAGERMERTAEFMRQATEYESGLTLNVAGTFSGVLMAIAAELRKKSLELATRADKEARERLRIEAELQ